MRPAQRTIPAVLLLGLLSSLLAGCGSTVQLQGTAAVGGQGLDGGTTGSGTTGTGGLASTTSGTGTGSTSGLGTNGGATGGGSGTSTGGGATGIGAGTGGAGTTGAAPVPSNPGLPKGAHDPVYVGIGMVKGYDQFYKSIGVKGSFGPQEQQAQAVLSYINAHGGLAGHPVKPVFASVDVTSSDSAPVQEQRACDTFTQDNHVIAAIANQRPNTLAACLNQRGVPFYVTSGEDYTKPQLAKWPFVAAPSTLSEEDAVRVLVDRAAAQGYFTATAQDLGPQVKIGYLYYDTPYQTAVAENVLVPLVKQHGVTTTFGVAITYPNSASDGSQAISAIQGAVLKFRGNGVTHVIILDNGGNMTFNFPTYAQSQGYKPRYAMNTFNAIGIEQDYTGSTQLERMVGVGWNPQFDVHEQQAPPATAAQTACLKIMKAGGVPGSEYGIQRSVQFDDCDALLALQLAANAAKSVKPSDLLAATRQLPSMPTAVTFGSSFAGRYPFSVTATRDFHYDPSCKCVAYFGPVHPLS